MSNVRCQVTDKVTAETIVRGQVKHLKATVSELEKKAEELEKKVKALNDQNDWLDYQNACLRVELAQCQEQHDPFGLPQLPQLQQLDQQLQQPGQLQPFEQPPVWLSQPAQLPQLANRLQQPELHGSAQQQVHVRTSPMFSLIALI